MAKWLDIKGPVVADTVYADSTLVAKDVSFTLPGIEFLTADTDPEAEDVTVEEVSEEEKKEEL